MTSTQGIVVALGGEKRFGTLVTEDAPRHMLELGFHPLVWYALRTLERGGVRDVFLVAAGEENAAVFREWLADSYRGACDVAVLAAPEDADTADAVRAARDRLVSDAVVVVHGDLVTGVSPRALLAAHARRGAVLTSLLAPRRPWCPVETKSGRPPKNAHYVGLAADGETLLFVGDDADVDKVLKLRRPVLRAAPDVDVRADLLQAGMFVFDVRALLDLLEAKPHFRSLRADVVPALTRRAASADASAKAATRDDDQNQNLKPKPRRRLARRPCLAHVSDEAEYCAAVDTVAPAYVEVSREVASSAPGDAAHLIGRAASKYDNFVDPGVVIGAKSTVGPGCVVRRDARLGEKCSVKRSVVGEGASVGAGVKIVNSIVMPRATIEDGCVVQGCVVGPRAVVGAGTTLRECVVRAEAEVEEGEDLRAETLK